MEHAVIAGRAKQLVGEQQKALSKCTTKSALGAENKPQAYGKIMERTVVAGKNGVSFRNDRMNCFLLALPAMTILVCPYQGEKRS